MTNGRTIGPVGTVARVIGGVAFLVLGVVYAELTWWDLLVAVFVLPGVAVAAAVIVNRIIADPSLRTRARSAWSGVQIVASAFVIAAVLGLGTALTFVSPVDGGSLYVFVGLSMLLAAARGYAGCEILAVPNLVLGRQDAIWCPIYSPLDRTDRDSDLASGTPSR
ncbi:DUF6410 domain-containing protein [Nocardioides antri]|uniref:Uncharacterized protein n=1 Tax=Nocardioides antri TaxID=2607659 RepID=A0A5B1MAN3_9ACTN|nr:DUF6410 domain-containing protein [Nocardioides antri]KAA1428780.1 hypothetical protein F0U47_00735 [Nocardioides antri]